MYHGDLYDRRAHSEDSIEPILTSSKKGAVIGKVRQEANYDFDIKDQRQNQFSLVKDGLMGWSCIDVPRGL